MKFIKLIHYQIFVLSFVLGTTPPCLGKNPLTFDSLIVELSKANDDTTKIFLLLRLANQVNDTDTKSLERYSMQALNISKKTKYVRGLAYSNYSLSRVYMYSEFDLAEKLLVKSLGFAEQIKDNILIAKIYNSIGTLLLKDQDKKDMALEYYDKALELLSRHNQHREIAALYSNIGMIYEKDIAAIPYFLKAAEINKQFENHLWLSINYLNIGITYLDLGDLEISFDYLQQSLSISEKYGFESHLSSTYVALGEYYYEMENYKTSIYYAEQALENAKEQINRVDELEALTLLKQNYVATKKLNEALEYYELIMSVNDSIYQHNQLNELAVIGMKNKYEEELEQQEVDHSLLEANYRNNKLTLIIIIISVSLLLVIFVLLFFYLQSRIARKTLAEEKLSKELEFRNKELTTEILYTIHKNDILLSILSGLDKLENNIVKEDVDNSIDQISRKIREFIEPNAWQEFEIRFQKVHVNFLKNLLDEFPSLTPNEKKLCAFLRLNMSSKEISKLTGQSIPTIEMARVRLRKKLGISNKKVNLVAFLSRF